MWNLWVKTGLPVHEDYTKIYKAQRRSRRSTSAIGYCWDSMGHLLQIMSAKSQNLMVYQHFPHKCQKLFLNIPFSHPSTVSPHHPIVLVYIYMYNSPKVSPMNLRAPETKDRPRTRSTEDALPNRHRGFRSDASGGLRCGGRQWWLGG